MVGQAIGPVIGGLLNSAWGYRSIFWFLFVLSAIVLVLLLILLPETHRRIAGNGSVPLSGVHRPAVYLVKPSYETQSPPESKTASFPKVLKSMTTPLRHVFEKDVFVLLLWGALVYTGWSMVTSSTTTVMINEFPSLTQLEVGLCFLPNGLGCILGSVLTGRLMDWNYKRIEAQHNPSNFSEGHPSKDKSFSLERARLGPIPYFSGVFIVAIALYGASYELNDARRYFSGNLAPSLILQFVIAFSATAVFCINSTMLVDCFPSGSAGATATNNLFRCLIGAAGVSVIQPLIAAVRIRNAFVILASIMLAFSPLIWLEWHYGERWRLARQNRKKQEEAV